MANLIIDIGNTRIKAALFNQEALLWEAAYEDLAQAKEGFDSLQFEDCLISSVRWTYEELRKEFQFDFLFLTHETAFPIQNQYASPHTLGLDRIAAAVGAWSKSGGKPVLAIDLGSCITYELVTERGQYLGGAISPGLRMRAKAMNQFTARLPLVELNQIPTELYGSTTVQCMQIGIWSGVRYEIVGQINGYQQEFPQLKVFVCGGDAQSFDSLVKDHIFVVPNLVLFGLNAILNHNVE
ncbi:type III pantothenate kinase [Algoriphagus marinus]|uniref:type III pantothenate kinase n=1 Tax=Algoriphagus marinus TaxID=1925762 RepID=UPI00094B9839|nr:type III pantothenate kinase [Algoriphagus marinus]